MSKHEYWLWKVQLHIQGSKAQKSTSSTISKWTPWLCPLSSPNVCLRKKYLAKQTQKRNLCKMNSVFFFLAETIFFLEKLLPMIVCFQSELCSKLHRFLSSKNKDCSKISQRLILATGNYTLINFPSKYFSKIFHKIHKVTAKKLLTHFISQNSL